MFVFDAWKNKIYDDISVKNCKNSQQAKFCEEDKLQSFHFWIRYLNLFHIKVYLTLMKLSKISNLYTLYFMYISSSTLMLIIYI